MQPAQYWRQTKEWSSWIGKQGTVVATTQVRVASPERAGLTPYAYALVEFGSERRSFMGVGHSELEVGNAVECVLRKNANSDKKSLIEYGIKVQKLSSSSSA